MANLDLVEVTFNLGVSRGVFFFRGNGTGIPLGILLVIFSNDEQDWGLKKSPKRNAIVF